MEFPSTDRRRDRHSPNESPSSSSAVAVVGTEEERELMFEKVVTPSDVGKLNRLVIPKQHAERYFPLDPASNDKGGLLLSFEEDRTGRPWRFRYSYWNSSQSYVMTKGWSRFVKDKRLDAGDTVAFSRAPVSGSLFIDWRRRPSPPAPLLLRSTVVPTWGWAGLFAPRPHPPPFPFPGAATDNNNNNDVAATSASAMYFRSVGPPLPPPQYAILDSVPVEPKRVRLFGVNLDCAERDRADDQYLQPPSPLQWSLSPSPSPKARDGERGQKEGSF